jgi:malonyl-CoA/methylmalonyl-CoA synthetase
MNLYSALRAITDTPDATFLRTPQGRTLTYGDLAAGSARFANALVALGVRPGDRVAVQVEKSPEVALLYVACLRAGAVYLPLNTAYTLNELAYFIGDAQPRVVVCDPKVEAGVATLADAVVTLDAAGQGGLSDLAAKQAEAFDTVARDGADLAAILYTSGTTGRSKGAMLTHANLASNASTLVKAWRFSAADVLLHALPIFHIHGLFVALNVPLMAGAALLYLPKFDPDAVLRLLPEATVMMGVPTFYVRLLQDARLDAALVKGVRLFVSGSAPLLAETHQQWAAATGQAILERYGMTETGMNTSNPYEGPRVAGTVGPPLPDVSLRITDADTGRALPRGEIGMIEVKGPNVFAGYWRMPEKTAAEFRADGYFITGDLGLLDNDGYVHIVGRGKDLIITGGFNVYPKEVEEEIDALPGVIESAVIGLPHPDLGEGVTAVVAAAAEAGLKEAAILRLLTTRLAGFKRPKRVLFVDDLPRNAMGKVQKAALRDLHAGLYAAPASPRKDAG